MKEAMENLAQILRRAGADFATRVQARIALGGDAVRTVEIPAAFNAGTDALREAGFLPCPKQ